MREREEEKKKRDDGFVERRFRFKFLLTRQRIERLVISLFAFQRSRRSDELDVERKKTTGVLQDGSNNKTNAIKKKKKKKDTEQTNQNNGFISFSSLSLLALAPAPTLHAGRPRQSSRGACRRPLFVGFNEAMVSEKTLEIKELVLFLFSFFRRRRRRRRTRERV